MTKRLFSVILALVIALGVLPLALQAAGKTVYTVTLKPGDGKGENIVYRSDEGEIAADFRSAGLGQFFYESDGRLGFHFNSNICPAEWTAPEGYVLRDFLTDSKDPVSDYMTLTQPNTVYTARWRPAGEPSISLSPSEITLDPEMFDENGFLPVTITITELDFGPNAKEDAFLEIEFYSGVMIIAHGSKRISYQVYGADHSDDPEYVIWAKYPQLSIELALHIDPAALAAAASETYEGNLDYAYAWNKITVPVGVGEGSIPLRLTKTCDVTVNGGTGGARYAVGDSVTVTAGKAPQGKMFKEWKGADDLSFTEGSAKTDTATFIMPDHPVNLTAVYDTAYTLRAIGGTGSGKYFAGDIVTVTANDPPEGKRFKEWSGLFDSWMIIAGSRTSPTVTFLMPDYSLIITAKYEDVPSVGVDPPEQPEQPSGKLCKWDNVYHGDSCWGKIVYFFHTVLWFLLIPHGPLFLAHSVGIKE